jgi:threonylcarbamoyladenosine tRNA methylthiotransferase MtaB
MRRPYAAAYYESLIGRIKERLPDASIGSDVIVGFPGETQAHFDEMRRMLERLPLTYLHVFPYSDRPGTAASLLAGKVHGLDVRARAQEIRAIGERKASSFRRSQIGRHVRALTVDDGQSIVTGNFLKLRLGVAVPRNQWVDAVIVDERRAKLSVERGAADAATAIA